jgi:glycosyltransferase involved in cell wall biosynthesis
MRVALLCDLPSERWVSMDRYAKELSAGIKRVDPSIDIEFIRPERPFSNAKGKPHALLNHMWRYKVYPLLARNVKADVCHILDHSYGHLAKQLPQNKIVITCHDLAPLMLDRENHSITLRLWRNAIKGLHDAKKVIAISSNTKQDLVNHIGIQPASIPVVYFGISKQFKYNTTLKSSARQMLGVEENEKLILHVGSCIPRKNISTLLKALTKIELPFKFLQVGGVFFDSDIQIMRSMNFADRVIQISSISDDELINYYNAADVFVFPSLYEGFGLPPIEAMACGLPVIAANNSALTEAVGNSGLLFDTLNVDALASSITKVLIDHNLATMLREQGLRHASQFTWEKCATETIAVYRSIFDQR